MNSSSKKPMIEYIEYKEQTLALILRHDYHSEGIEFFTQNDFTQQLGYMNRPEGYEIKPHVHNPVAREISYTKEVLIIKTGKVRVDFYNDQQVYLESRILNEGDIVLLAFGGHGFKMIEDSEIVEVKQGPYAGEADKTRFNAISDEQVILSGDL